MSADMILHRIGLRPEKVVILSKKFALKERKAGKRSNMAGQAKFSDSEIYTIRRRLANGELPTHIAKHLGVAGSCITRINRRETYTHIP